MNIFKKNRALFSSILCVSLIFGQCNQIQAFSIGSITRSIRSIFSRKKPESKITRAKNCIQNNFGIKTIFALSFVTFILTALLLANKETKNGDTDNTKNPTDKSKTKDSKLPSTPTNQKSNTRSKQSIDTTSKKKQKNNIQSFKKFLAFIKNPKIFLNKKQYLITKSLTEILTDIKKIENPIVKSERLKILKYEAKKLFESVSFNRFFLHILQQNHLITFVSEFKDMHERTIVEACKLYCKDYTKDKEIIDAILPHDKNFKLNMKNSELQDFRTYLAQDKTRAKNKIKNPEFYRQKFNKLYVFHTLNKITKSRYRNKISTHITQSRYRNTISAHITSFVDEKTATHMAKTIETRKKKQ